MYYQLYVLLIVIVFSCINCQNTVSDCFNGLQYVHIDTEFDNFPAAVVGCFEENAIPAEITTEEENTFVTTFVDEISNQDVYIGLQKFNDTLLPNDPKSYEFFTSRIFIGEVNDFATVAEEFPWVINEPSNSNNQLCVRIEISEANLWRNNGCTNNLRVVCQRNCPPTNSPTTNPTINPTISPTINPTLSPTTHVPTISPTTSPTKLPTVSPTTSPSKIPTKFPSSSPTTQPTERQPTQSPTISPSVGEVIDEGIFDTGLNLAGDLILVFVITFCFFGCFCIILACFACRDLPKDNVSVKKNSFDALMDSI